MFTGIVEEVGRLARVDSTAGMIRVECRDVLGDAVPGSSIAVDGCCLTVAETGPGWFEADVMPETLRRTTLGSRGAGDGVNLEAAMRHDGRVGGHLVTGHIDGVGVVSETHGEGNATWVAITAPAELLPLLVEKGCVAVDGVSLTVVDVLADGFTVSLVPHTHEHTTAAQWSAGRAVNLEGDLVAKYIQRHLAVQAEQGRPLTAAGGRA